MRYQAAIDRRRVHQVAAGTALVSILHFITPAGPHGWHWFHILLQKLYYLPILAAAATLGTRATVATASAVSVLFLAHIIWSWKGHVMVQADQVGEIVSFWVIGLTASFLFSREKRALEATAAAHGETLEALVGALDLREHGTALHSRRVRDYALLLARRMGIEEGRALMNIGMGSLLHDVGKIGVSDRILLKRERLTEEEWDEMRRHPELGASLVGSIPFLAGVREIVHDHHEKFDGTGYPKGISGREIPIGARIFAVVDVFDALTSERTYRPGVSGREAVDIISRGRGNHFDPDVVDAFLGIPFPVWAGVAARNGVTLRKE
ncbi:MAG: HD domain-containing protein [Deltaproteobacteria bacterium]|nr:HD domain-containing protein [Deltaproteobacteria bacterium]